MNRTPQVVGTFFTAGVAAAITLAIILSIACVALLAVLAEHPAALQGTTQAFP
jgi:hypothetical protein